MVQTNTISQDRQIQHSNIRRIKNNVTGETLEFIKTAHDTDGAYAEFEVTSPPSYKGPPRHAHQLQEETIRVISGRLGVELEGKKQVLGRDETITVPAGQKHGWWVEGSEPAKAHVRITPALHFAEFLDAMIGQSANARNSASPSPIDAAVIMMRFRDEYDMSALPLPVRAIVMPLLALIGRLNGRAKVIDGWISEHYK